MKQTKHKKQVSQRHASEHRAVVKQFLKPDLITQTGLHCSTCHTDVYSNHRHDFKSCNCPDAGMDSTQISVDGGFDYTRRVAGQKASFTTVSRTITKKELAEEIERDNELWRQERIRLDKIKEKK